VTRSSPELKNPPTAIVYAAGSSTMRAPARAAFLAAFLPLFHTRSTERIRPLFRVTGTNEPDGPGGSGYHRARLVAARRRQERHLDMGSNYARAL